MASTGDYRVRDIKIPYITALDDEDTAEDLDKFGVTFPLHIPF